MSDDTRVDQEPEHRHWREVLFSGHAWWRRGVFIFAAIATGFVALFFNLADQASENFRRFLLDGKELFGLTISDSAGTWVAMAMPVLGLWLVMTLRDRFFPGTQGTGIPQVMASLGASVDDRLRSHMLSWRIAIGKSLLLVLGFFSGATIGREGPSVHVGACLFYLTGSWTRVPAWLMQRALIMAGGAAGIAAAFNAPIAGAVFAIEEIGRSFEKRTAGLILLACAISCTLCWVYLGDYLFYGRLDPGFTSATQWLVIVPIAATMGVLGGAFARAVVAGTRWVNVNLHRHRVLLPLGLGLGLGLLGLISGGLSYGSGYSETVKVLQDGTPLPIYYPFVKAAANFISLISGIPGGLFDPSFSVGASMGQLIAPWFPGVDPRCIVMLSMASYFTGVVRSPITTVVILLEMTSARDMAMPLFIACVIAYEASRLVAKKPIYEALAEIFLQDLRVAQEKSQRAR